MLLVCKLYAKFLSPHRRGGCAKWYFNFTFVRISVNSPENEHFFPQRHIVDSEALLPGPHFSLQTHLTPNMHLTEHSSYTCDISVSGVKHVLCLSHTFGHVVFFPGKSLLLPYPRLLLSYCFLSRASSGFSTRVVPCHVVYFPPGKVHHTCSFL